MGIKYNTFLNSEWWKFLRQKRLHKSNRCNACGSKYNLHIHHYNYEFKYAGLASKAIKHTKVLCASCHQEFHQRFGVKKDMTKEMDNFLQEIWHQKHKAKKMWEEVYEMEEWLSKI